MFCTVILKTELSTSAKVTVVLYFLCFYFDGGFNENVYIDIANLISKVSCGHLFVCSSSVSVLFSCFRLVRLIFRFS